MSLVAWVGVKGVHGASTGGLAVAGVWPNDRKVVFAEADPAGGDLAARFGLAPDPGLVELGAVFRHALSEDEIWSHTQALPGGVPALVAPSSAQQARALGALWAHLGPVLAELADTDVIADCGRAEPGSPALDIVRNAHLVVLVASPTLQGVAHLHARLAAPASGAPAGIVLVGERPYSAAEVEAAVGVKVVGVLPHDHRAAAMLNGEPGSRAALNRSPLVRAARQVAATVAAVARSQQRAARADLARVDGVRGAPALLSRSAQ
ncbi:MAG: carbon monoxide dehydrogenase maturation protein [Acidimicrobiia bacterium]|nr:carbon monoxide dehydrogenase maturation protein [Acidimicrobiia bacterium]